MKRKITIKTLIIAIMITAILSGTVGVIAVKLSASDIGFKSNHEDWTANNVNDAMNDLYILGKNNKKAEVFTTSPIDMKEYTDRWEELTTDDFIAATNKVNYHSFASSQTSNAMQNIYMDLVPEYTYDNTTGILTFEPSYQDAIYGNYHDVKMSSNIFVIWLGTVAGK